MTTLTDIIIDALQKDGVYAPGETISSADMTTSFNVFNDLLEDWSTQSLAAYANLDQSLPLVGGTSAYTFGPNGTGGSVRPLAINSAPGSAYIVDAQSNLYAVTVIDQAAWNSISSRNIAGTYPQWIFYDPQFPLGVLNVWPTPSSGYTLHFTSRLAFVDAANMLSTISLPPGYAGALKWNLAEALIPYFPEQSAASAPFVIKQATKTLANLKRVNTVVPTATFDSGLCASAPYNIYTDR